MNKRHSKTPISTPEMAREAIRGTSALVDGVRFAYAIWQAPEIIGRRICGHMSLISSNIFAVANPDEVIHCIWCDDSNDKTDLGLGSDTANGLSVVGNFADMRGAKSGSRFMNVDPSKIGKTPRGLVFATNQLWGGSGLIAGADWDDDAQLGNVWVR